MGCIPGAEKMGRVWLIPKKAPSPLINDMRKAGKSMLHIAICDDEKDFVQYLTDLLNQYSKETGRDIKITAYWCGIKKVDSLFSRIS